MDVRELHREALDAFSALVDGVAQGEWHQPTPCHEWDVRALVNHVVGENRWAPLLLDGATVTEVGSALDGDLLGDDAVGAWHASAKLACDAAARAAPDATVHLSFGDVPAGEYLWQLTADALVHAWDLARATGQPEPLPRGAVDACAQWFDGTEDAYRAAGVIGAPIAVDDGSPQDVLLARFGRNPSPLDPLAAVVRFNEAFGAHDLDAIGAAITDDCRFVDTAPPDGQEHAGRAAVLAAFGAFFSSSPSASFVTEHGVVAGNRVVLQWRYDWQENGAGHVRGVDLFTVREGKVAEKQSYVKG